ncbi:MAG TPA: AraC family transcriptional regulator [Blastocatellia bacterium]|jgi:AraC-type DNA-binding domain-containing proteins
MASRRILESGVSPPDQEQFHGESLKSCSVPGFVLSECRYPPNFETPMHAHERALFCMAVEGAYTARYGPKTCTCEPSSLLFHAPNEMHSVHFQNSGGRFFIIEIEQWWLEWAREHGAVIDFSSDFKGGSLAMFGMNLYQEFLSMDEVSPLIVEGLMLAIIGKASRHASADATSHPPRWLEQARQLMRDRFTETLTLAEIARNVGVSPSYLAQMFHKHYFTTVGGYIRQLRLEFACREMAASDAPLCEIALAAGFSDQSHLSRLFKRHMGIAPARYRESFAGPKRKG